MSPLDYIGVGAAGFAVGIINTIAGAGSLLSFPVLLATGLSPLAANVTNNIGIVPGAATGAYGQRAELTGQKQSMLRIGAPIFIGSLIGAVLLLTLPGSAFDKIVPILVLLAVALVGTQPWIKRYAASSGRELSWQGRGFAAVLFVMGIYGGYFGAGMGVLLVGFLGLLPEPLRLTNARKTVFQGVTNGAASIVFIIGGPIHWLLALVLAVTSSLGGPIGARLSKIIPPGPLRVLIVVVGLGVAIHLAIDAY